LACDEVPHWKFCPRCYAQYNTILHPGNTLLVSRPASSWLMRMQWYCPMTKGQEATGCGHPSLSMWKMGLWLQRHRWLAPLPEYAWHWNVDHEAIPLWGFQCVGHEHNRGNFRTLQNQGSCDLQVPYEVLSFKQLPEFMPLEWLPTDFRQQLLEKEAVLNALADIHVDDKSLADLKISYWRTEGHGGSEWGWSNEKDTQTGNVCLDDDRERWEKATNKLHQYICQERASAGFPCDDMNTEEPPFIKGKKSGRSHIKGNRSEAT